MSNPTDAFENELQALLDQDRQAPAPTPTSPTPATPLPADEQPPLPFDVDAERQAYSDLIAFMKASKEPGTEITFLTVDEFMSGLD